MNQSLKAGAQSTVKNSQSRILRTDALLLAGVCGFLFFYGLNVFGLVGADEPRYAQIAREMLARHDWITPVLGGKAWLEKPVLYYWQAMLAYSAFGVSDWAARIPSALDATLMVVAAYLFLRRFRPGSQLDGALMIASSAATIGFARAAATDMPLAAMFTIAMLGWYAWRESGARSYLAVFYVFLGLATLAKGPVAPVLTVMVVIVFAAMVRDWRLPLRSLWVPGIALFLLVTLPWYVAVQLRNPEFFRVFILEHNFARFSTDLYRHVQPFWYFIPVMLLGLLPWTAMALSALVESARVGWSERKHGFQAEDEYNVFLLLWLLLPIFFFSISQSKLPGYILPALPAGALLIADYVRRRLTEGENCPKWLAVIHGLFTAGLLVPAVFIAHLLLQKKLPWGRPTIFAGLIALFIAAAISFTLTRKAGLRYLHFVTLVPVVLAVSAILRFGGTSADMTLSARPVEQRLASVASPQLPAAVLRISRDKEYGLAFYRNQPIARYERGEIPASEHVLVAPANSQADIAHFVGERYVSFLGSFPLQHLEFYQVGPAAAP